MISIKTTKEIEVMKEGGKKLAWVFSQVLKKIEPGVTLRKLDRLAEILIKKKDGVPSFKTIRNYHWTTCINVNEGVVHGIPNDYQLKTNDLVSLDMGMLFKGLHTDMACTVQVRNSKSKILNSKFLEAGKRALKMAIRAAKAGNRVGHISQAIEKEIKKAGFNPVRELTGHGVGRKLHEEPKIPCFLADDLKKTPLLKSGMSLAVEVIYVRSKPDLIIDEDGWTLKTEDGKPAGLFENSLVVTKGMPLVLTTPLRLLPTGGRTRLLTRHLRVTSKGTATLIGSI